ncbi:endonuclease/exonuclease/phosphatase family protein [Isoptericola sp. 4D.3]|uniref:Endonuclease/exonuclease/phosphatase family protein n=1 Tax=Isoptericola peretonis TaxID=2918523 RepID=A0ABT0J0L7_9MICO|nr:endonuclease/exonuclease/phosphatase family protein [Isoptericola sp. 4D.3]
MRDVVKHARGAGRPRKGGRRGRVLVALAAVTALLLLGHRWVPDAGGLGSLVETFLPWLGLVVPLLVAGAVLRRSAVVAVAAVVVVAVWVAVCVPLPVPGAPPAGPHDGDRLVVVQHNVSDTNADPDGTAAVLLAADPDVVALVEVTPPLVAAFGDALGEALPYRSSQGTVAVWSRHPLTEAEPVDLRPPGVAASWDRGLRVTVDTPGPGGARLYAVHLPSVRLGTAGLGTTARDESIARLGAELSADAAPVLLVAGDLNTALEDRALAPVTAEVTGRRQVFGFTFPAAAPVVRIDHVLARGASVVSVAPLGRTASDHLPVVAEVALPPG